MWGCCVPPASLSALSSNSRAVALVSGEGCAAAIAAVSREQTKRSRMTYLTLSFSKSLRHVAHAAEADIGGGAIHRVRRACGHAIPVAIRLVAEIRPALHHLGCALRRSYGIQPRARDVKARIE